MTGPAVAVAGTGAGRDWDRARTRLWTASGAGMLALHLGMLLAAILWSPRPTAPPMPPEAMIIDLAPAPVSRPQDVSPETMPPPVPIRKADVAPPKPKPRAAPAPAASAPKVPAETLPASVEPVAEALPRPTPAVPPAAASSPPGVAVATWQSRLLAHLERYKRYPAAARARRQEGVVAIRFVMDGSGTVVSSKLERSADYALLDDEGLALLERAQPLPSPPPEIGNRIELVVPIQFFLKEGR